jgi:hypothetical protein
MDTRIAIVRGLNDNRGRGIGKDMPFVNYLVTTEGELSLELAKQRLWVYNGLYPEKQKIWLHGKALIDNALYNAKGQGIHGETPYLGFLNDELKFVGAAIKAAAKQTQSATNLYIGRTDKGKGLNPDLRSVGLAGINGVDTIWDDAFKSFKEMNAGCFRLEFNGGTPRLTDTFLNFTCESRFNLMVKLNTMLPKNSHNGIYCFMPFVDANNPNLTPATTAAKVNDHNKYFETLRSTAEISKDNLGIWLKNAVMHKNVFHGSESVTPEDNIKTLRANPDQNTKELWYSADTTGIGIAPLIIVLIIIVAGKVLGGLIQICKDKEPTAFQGLDDIALRAIDFAASGTDFKGIKTGGGIDKNCPTGYVFDEVEQMCVRQTTGGGGTGTGGGGTGGNDTPTTGGNGVMTWIQDNPLTSALIGGGVALTLGGAFKGK